MKYFNNNLIYILVNITNNIRKDIKIFINSEHCFIIICLFVLLLRYFIGRSMGKIVILLYHQFMDCELMQWIRFLYIIVGCEELT
jgi:hypothetical protein